MENRENLPLPNAFEKNITDIQKLVATVEEKRQLLNKIYDDSKSKDPSKLPVAQIIYTGKPMHSINKDLNILKQVHFVSSDEEETKPFNSTYKVTKTKESSPIKQNKMLTKATNSKQIQKSPLKTKSANSVVSNTKLPLKQHQNLTLQQKRKIAEENKAKLERALAVLRLKILTRKFGYIWLRRYLYASSAKNALLPSQIE